MLGGFLQRKRMTLKSTVCTFEYSQNKYRCLGSVKPSQTPLINQLDSNLVSLPNRLQELS